jgi:hypothetical protein
MDNYYQDTGMFDDDDYIYAYDYDYDYDDEEYENGDYVSMRVLQTQIEKLTKELQEERNLRALAFKDIIRDINTLKAENQELREFIEVQESKSRKNNIVIFGIEKSDNNETSAENTVRHICNELDVEIENCITDAYRIGREKGKRPIICQISSYNKKVELMKKNRINGQYAMLNDLTKKERREKKELKCYIDADKLQGKKVSYRHGKVYMDGVIFSKEGLKNIGNVAAPKEDEGGKHSPPLQTAHKKATSPVVETENCRRRGPYGPVVVCASIQVSPCEITPVCS